MSKLNLSKIANDIHGTLVKRSPEILTGIGIAGMIATTVMAVRATPKALHLIVEAEDEKIENDETFIALSKKEIIQAAWKCYIPAAATGLLSIACLIGASSVNLRRNAALAAAYTLSESALREYQEKTTALIGEKKEQAVRDAIAKDKIEKTPIGFSEVLITGGGESLCFDVFSSRYFKSDIEKLRKAENEMNFRLLNEDYVCLNDFYEEIGLSTTKIGNLIGWNVSKDKVELIFSSQLSEDGKPCLVLDFRSPPTYNFDR